MKLYFCFFPHLLFYFAFPKKISINKTFKIESIIEDSQGYIISGVEPTQHFGSSFSRKNGDFNCDGFKDLLVHSCSLDSEIQHTYVMFGSNNNFVTNISKLDGSNGFIIIYNNFMPYNCEEIANDFIGDVNNDGIDDIMICSMKSISKVGPGRCFIIFGSKTWYEAILDLTIDEIETSLGDKGKIFSDNMISYELSMFGYAFSGISDINGDGKSDFAICNGISLENSTSVLKHGRCYIILDLNAFSDKTNELNKFILNGTNGFSIEDEFSIDTETLFGWNIAGLGDINGDNYADFMISAHFSNKKHGSVYVIFGNSSFPASFDMNDLLDSKVYYPSGFKIINSNSGKDLLGYKILGNFDINGDGLMDIMISAPNWNQYRGIIYVIYGSRTIFDKIFDVAKLNGVNGFVILGDKLDRYLGGSLALANDLNQDGINDILIGIKGIQTIIVYGNKSFNRNLSIENLDGSNGFFLNCYNDSSVFVQFSGIGDINNDTIDDFAIGIYDGSINFYEQGYVLIVTGGALSQYRECPIPSQCSSKNMVYDRNTQGIYDLLNQDIYERKNNFICNEVNFKCSNGFQSYNPNNNILCKFGQICVEPALDVTNSFEIIFWVFLGLFLVSLIGNIVGIFYFLKFKNKRKSLLHDELRAESENEN